MSRGFWNHPALASTTSPGKFEDKEFPADTSVFGEVSVSELRLLSRVPTLPDTTLAAMKARVVAAGVPQATVDKLKVGEYVAC